MSAASELPRAFGSYSLLKMLAKGGMGEIYLARTVGITGFEKYYAVKKLLKKFTHDADVGGRFVDEAKLGARLQHPNIVQVYDLGKVNEELYMATEFVDGFDLRRVLRFCHEKKKRIPLDIALFIVREVLSGLAYAHRQVDAEGNLINLIHRDISPQNVLVSFEGEVKIIDFGLAKSTQRSQETQANVLLGNFGYMSPEQARGQVLDVRTDVYSCGIVLFELVTGTKRFVEENPLKLLEMVARPTPILPSDRVPSVPKAVDKIYEKATALDKEQRYPSAEAFRDDITAALHRLNPKASRENLAQFLNHLFLGGQAPPTVDNDVLNKSVVLIAKDLHADNAAFSGSAVDDLKNRNLASAFADDAPQTASHQLLRSARIGDELSHEAITGERTGDGLEIELSDDGVKLDAAFDGAFEGQGLTARIHNDVAASPPPQSSSDGAVIADDSVLDENARPTAMYNSPSWPAGEAVDMPEPTQIRPSGPSRSELDVQRQLEEQALAAERAQQLAQQEAQRQVQKQLEEQQRQVELQAQLQMQMQAQMEAQLEAQRQAEVLLKKEQLALAQRQAQLEEAAQKQALQRQLEQQARQQQLQAQLAEAQLQAQVQAQPTPSAKIRPLGSGTSTETAMPAVNVAPAPSLAKVQKLPTPPIETPSIMIADDLLASEAEVIETVRNPKAQRSDGGFGTGSTHESLIIDFAGEADESASDEGIEIAMDPDPASTSTIRPAAKPAGRSIPAIAKPRRLSEEGPPTSMPPPTRRRS